MCGVDNREVDNAGKKPGSDMLGFPAQKGSTWTVVWPGGKATAWGALASERWFEEESRCRPAQKLVSLTLSRQNVAAQVPSLSLGCGHFSQSMAQALPRRCATQKPARHTEQTWGISAGTISSSSHARVWSWALGTRRFCGSWCLAGSVTTSIGLTGISFQFVSCKNMFHPHP